MRRNRQLPGCAAAWLATSVLISAANPIPTDGLSMWLRADQGVAANATGVSQWSDQSGQGHHAYQGVAANRPTLATSALGKPAIRFDGVDTYLAFTNSINGLSGLTLFLVANNRSPTQDGGAAYSESPAIFWNESASWGASYLSPFQGNVNWRIGAGLPSSDQRFERPVGIGLGVSITCLVKNGDVESLYVDKAPAQTVSELRFTSSGGRADGYLGRGISTYFAGDILEVLVYRVALTDADRQTVEDNLIERYFANASPTVAILSPAESDEFTAPATIPVSAQATDDQGVAKVEFLVDGQTIATKTAEPYEITWNNVPAGAYTLTVRAADGQGAWAAVDRVVRVNYRTSRDGPPLADLELWYKADAGVATEAGRVVQWNDQSGYGRHASQTSTHAQPMPATGGNGKPAVAFDGLSQCLNFSMPMNGREALSLVVVANNTAPQNGGVGGDGNTVLYWPEPATPGWGGLSLGIFQDSATWRIGTTVPQTGSPNYPGPAYTRPASLGREYSRTVVVKDGGTEQLYVNGQLVVTAAGKAPTTAGIVDRGGVLGRGVSGEYPSYFRGEIQEVLAYSHALSSDERDRLEIYLKAKYWTKAQPQVAIGAPAGPATFAAPTNLVVTATASDADGSVAKVEFYDNGKPIGAATAAPWRVTLTNAAPGGHLLTAKATDRDGLFNYSQPVLACGQPASGFAPIETFEKRSAAPLLFQGNWLGALNGDSVRLDPTTFEGGNPTNQVLRLATRGQSLSCPVLIPQGATGTLFLRVASTTWSRDDVSLGLSDAPSIGYAPESDYEVQLGRWTKNNLANPNLGLYDGAALLESVTAFESDAWYRLWLVVDNAKDTWQLYVQGGSLAQPTLVARPDTHATSFRFRSGTASNPLIRFLIRSPLQLVSNGATGGFWVDDIYLAAGKNLNDPTLPPGMPLPPLSISRSGNKITLAWAVTSSPVLLQSSASLFLANWSDVNATPVTSGGQVTVTLTIGDTVRYYRLRSK